MDEFFIKDLQQKYLNHHDDSFDLSSDHQEQKYLQYIESDLANEEPASNDDFRYQIEQRYLKSRVNQSYVFPRKMVESDDDSLTSVAHLGVYDLASQGQPPRTNYKTLSTELQRTKPTGEGKNKRLKTEGNEKCDEGHGGSFRFHSDSEISEDVVQLVSKVHNKKIVTTKSKATKQRRKNSSQKYQTILDDLQRKLHTANVKEHSQSRLGKLLNVDEPPAKPIVAKPSCLNDCEKLYGRQSLKRTLSNKRSGSSTKQPSRQLKTSQGYYDPTEYYDITNYQTRVKSNSNSTAHQSQFYTNGTSGSRSRNKMQQSHYKHNTEITPIPTKSSSSKKPSNLHTLQSESRQTGLSKAYLQQNNNLASKYRNKLAQKRPETQQDVSRPCMLTHDYLLQILSQQQKKQVTKVQQPVFNLNNSNINFNVNIQGSSKPKRMSDLVNHSMAVADLIKQQKQQERNVPEKRSLSQQRSKGSVPLRFKTDPDEGMQPQALQKKQLESLLMQKLPKRTNKSQSSSRCNTETMPQHPMQTNQYLNCLKQCQTMQMRQVVDIKYFIIFISTRTTSSLPKKNTMAKFHKMQLTIDPTQF